MSYIAEFGPLLTDAYKVAHAQMYPKGTTLLYSNFTPRGDKYAPFPAGTPYYDGRITTFGIYGALMELNNAWQSFFSMKKYDAMEILRKTFTEIFGTDVIDLAPFAALHDLGYLPVQVNAIPEGTKVPVRIPIFVIYNTHPDFAWITNYLESYLSAALWKPNTVATIASAYQAMAIDYAKRTCDDESHVPFQFHDFSMRGLSNPQDSLTVGAAHLSSFRGTDSVAAVRYVASNYVNIYERKKVYKNIGNSVPASEHAVMMMWLAVGTEKNAILELLKKYPTGILSLVMDTLDYWNVLTDILPDPEVKAAILARDGKLVIRPDSGDPLKIICGDPEAPLHTPERAGSLYLLASTFGSSLNNSGYNVINPHVGLIYGDSITFVRAEAILSRMADQMWASSNIVFGVGSFSYQYLTRDTFAFAMKATYCEIAGKGHNLLKDPKTDDGTKKSASGLLRVEQADNGTLSLKEKVTWEEAKMTEHNAMVCYFYNGKFPVLQVNPTFIDIFHIRRKIEEDNRKMLRVTTSG